MESGNDTLGANNYCDTLLVIDEPSSNCPNRVY